MPVPPRRPQPASTWASGFGDVRPRQRRIAQALAIGERTKDVAKRFKLSPGRIAQLRAEFREAWLAFQGESCRRSTIPSEAA